MNSRYHEYTIMNINRILTEYKLTKTKSNTGAGSSISSSLVLFTCIKKFWIFWHDFAATFNLILFFSNLLAAPPFVVVLW